MAESIELAPQPTSVSVARHWTTDVLARVDAGEVADTMALLVSELVSNVVLHARTPCSLRIDRHADRIRVEVDDESDQVPEAGVLADPLAASGRGLLLVDGLSSAYGVDRRPTGGKSVWFELDVPGPA
ncbi:MAG: ATP-binding protein [Acidimicrobiales bacterium]|nr:ATP-binding protein [Acidimicrobiales bacterium]